MKFLQDAFGRSEFVKNIMKKSQKSPNLIPDFKFKNKKKFYPFKALIF